MDYRNHVKGVVTRRNDLTGSLRILNIRPERRLPFVPGQYATIGLKNGARIVERPYSLTSKPEALELEFPVEAVPGGQLSPCLCALPVGADVFLRRAARGLFTFDSGSGHKDHFMIATGTGGAPYLSMVRE
jgi:ferredoxin--NADP+ reductase